MSPFMNGMTVTTTSYVMSFLRKESCPSMHHSRRGGKRFKHVASSSSSKEQIFIIITVSYSGWNSQ